MERITIDPVTRLEGHGKIEIFLDPDGEVANAYFQIPELRGFERFCVGRPVEEMPTLTNRICGVCPEAHHMAAAKAADAVYHVDPPRTGQAPARAALQRLLRHRPHHPLLRPGRPRLRRRAGRPGGRAQHPGRPGQGRHGSRRQGHPGPQAGPQRHRDDRRPQDPPGHRGARRHDQGHHRGAARRDREDRPLVDRVRPVQPGHLRPDRPGQRRLQGDGPLRRLHPPDLLHGPGGPEQARSTSTTARSASCRPTASAWAPTPRPSTATGSPSTSSPGPTSSSPT